MENINNMINTETTIFSLYEASILGDIETAINKDDITEALWKGLCNFSSKNEYQDAAKMLTDLLKSDAVEASLVRKARSTAAFVKDPSKCYIHVAFNGRNYTHTEILIPGLKIFVDWISPFAKTFNSNFYNTVKDPYANNAGFHSVFKECPVYELPDELKPFVNKCIECVNKHTRKKFNLI